MRILYHHPLASKDGQYVHVEEIVTALRRLGHDVAVAGPALTDATAFGGEAGLVSTLKRRLPKAAYEVLELGYWMAAERRLAEAARARRAEVIEARCRLHRRGVIYERYTLHLPAGAGVARRLPIPFLLEVNGPLAQERATFGGIGLPR